jgi:integrative and conjugative element protein (TIGR02256 family)
LKEASSAAHGQPPNLLEESDSLYAWQWYFRELGVKLLVSKSVYHLFDRNRQFGKKHECGGLLFVHNNHRDGVVLCLATPPNSKDKSTRYSLDFDHERCRIETKEANEKNLRLIGYWHTHPEDIPDLSSQDMYSFRQLIKDNNHELPSPFAIIVGRNSGPEGIRAWLIRDNARFKAEFQPITKG